MILVTPESHFASEKVDRTEGALRSSGSGIPGSPESRKVTFGFVWLFGALVSMRAIDYDLQDFFGTCLYMERYLKKYFVSVLARGMVDPAPALWLDPGNLALAGNWADY